MSAKKKPTITKQELYSLLPADTQLYTALFARIFTSQQKIFQNALQHNQEVIIPPGIKFTVVTVQAIPARQGHIPATGEPIQITAKPVHTAVQIRALQPVHDMLNLTIESSSSYSSLSLLSSIHFCHSKSNKFSS
uniref:p104R n=1 Tax=African swine fever virus TaxID=10497 RepID=A0A6G7KTP0_ASF